MVMNMRADVSNDLRHDCKLVCTAVCERS